MVRGTLIQCHALTETQFSRFMFVIRQLGDQVERERTFGTINTDVVHLREQHNVQSHTDEVVGGLRSSRKSLPSTFVTSNDLDFETLVGQTQTVEPTGLDMLLDHNATPSTELPALLNGFSKSSKDNFLGTPRTPLSNSSPTSFAPRAHVDQDKVHSINKSTPALGAPQNPGTTFSQPTTACTIHHTGLFDVLVTDAQVEASKMTPASSQPNFQRNSGPIPPGWEGGLLKPQVGGATTSHVPSTSSWADFDPLK